MALATVADLEAALVDWSARTDLSTTVIDSFITLAEADIQNGVYDLAGNCVTPPLRTRSMETYDAAFALVGEYTPLPDGFLEAREVKLTSQADRPPLLFITGEAFDSNYGSSDSGPPVAYTIVGTQIRVGPGASATDTLGLTYWAALETLVGSGLTPNWLMTKAPNVYLYGALRHLGVYTGDEAKEGVFQSAFVTALMGVIKSEHQGSFGGSGLAQRATGVTIT